VTAARTRRSADAVAAPDSPAYALHYDHATPVVNGADILTPASIEYDRARGRMLIPLLKADQLRIETWPPPP
jgi:hypothetical protein